jgi:hypothetical protein
MDREVLAHIAVAHQLHDGAPVDPALEGRMHPEGGQFRAEQKRPRVAFALPAEIERLFPHPVADQAQNTGLAIPDGDGEHAHRAGDRGLDPPGVEACQQRLGVRMPAPGRGFARTFQLGAQVEMIVDLAVVADHVAPRGRRHGLMPRGAEIEDREPAMAKGDARCGIGPGAVTVGPAPRDGAGHGERGAFGLRLIEPLGQAQKAGYSAHCSRLHRLGMGQGERVGPDAIAPLSGQKGSDARGFLPYVELRQNPGTASLPHARARLRIGQGGDGMRQALGIARRHDKTRHPSSTSSETPPTCVAITGLPEAIASISTTGTPSAKEGSTSASAWLSVAATPS